MCQALFLKKWICYKKLIKVAREIHEKKSATNARIIFKLLCALAALRHGGEVLFGFGNTKTYFNSKSFFVAVNCPASIT